MRSVPRSAVPLAARRLIVPIGLSLVAAEFAFFHENVMGTSLELRVNADSAGGPPVSKPRPSKVLLREIDRPSPPSSAATTPASEFRALAEHPWRFPVPVSPFRVGSRRSCKLSDHGRAATAGAFDPRVEVLSRLWSDSSKQGRTPTDPEIASARTLMSRDAWRLDPSARTAERLTECPLSLDAIAKGYIVGRASDAALKPDDGARGVLLNVGGDLRVCGEMTRTIGVADPKRDSESSEPLTSISVRDRAVSTSGNSQRGFRINGRWYSHIFDPRTGQPVERTASATVVARASADADALATAFNVLSPRGMRPPRRVVARRRMPDRLGRRPRLARRRPAARDAAALKAARFPEGRRAESRADGVCKIFWGDEFELVVNFEINRPEAEKGRYRRPYVAVWVEDKEGFPVRNLSLWVSLGGSGPFQWLPDLKRWYKGDQARKRVDKTEMVLTIARPTRPPGKYSVIWDGKDDHGKPLPRGEYTLCIDAAREHGTYQNLRTPVTIADAPFGEELKGGVEIKAASVEYRKKPAAK